MDADVRLVAINHVARDFDQFAAYQRCRYYPASHGNADGRFPAYLRSACRLSAPAIGGEPAGGGTCVAVMTRGDWGSGRSATGFVVVSESRHRLQEKRHVGRIIDPPVATDGLGSNDGSC